MSTQLFKAKDMKSAINLVNEEFGDNAIILSTSFRLHASIRVWVPRVFDFEKIIELSKELSTWLSAARFITKSISLVASKQISISIKSPTINLCLLFP